MRDPQGLDRAPPGSPGDEKGPQSLAGTAAPRQERRETLPFAISNGTRCGDGAQSSTDAGSAHSPADGVIATYECGPHEPFEQVKITFLGAPDYDGRRTQMVFDLVWGRFSRPPEDPGIAIPVPPRSPVLTGGAAAKIETPAMAA